MQNKIAGVPARMKWGGIQDKYLPDMTLVDNFAVAYGTHILGRHYAVSETARPLNDFMQEITHGLRHIRAVTSEMPVKKGYIVRSLTTIDLLAAFMHTDFFAEDTPGGVMVYAELKPAIADKVRKTIQRRN